MQQRLIGTTEVSAIGLGAMPLSVAGEHVPEQRAIRTIHAALDAGVTLIDTADAYSPDGTYGHNERLVARALASYGGDTTSVLVATKGGHTRYPDGGWGLDGRPEHIRRACEASLRALGVDAIGLYQYHRPDPAVPYAEALGAFRELYDQGKVRMVGISNTDVAQIRLAQEVVGEAFVSVQNQLSPKFRSSEEELVLCAEQAIAFLPYSPLGGMGGAAVLGDHFAPFAEVGRERGVSPQQVCLAWLLAASPVVIPIPGSSRPETATASAAAVQLSLTPDELARLDATG